MTKFNIIIAFYFGIIFGVSYAVYDVERREDIERNDVCYQGFKDGLEHLSGIYNRSPSVSKISFILDDVNILINKTENIILNTRKMYNVKNKSRSDHEAISQNSRKLNILKSIVDDINLITTKLNELKRKKDIRSNVSNECSQADTLYGSLRDDVGIIKKIGKDAIALLDVPNCVDEIKRDSLTIKKNLDNLNIPEFLFQSYVCNSRLPTKIGNIIRNIEEIAKMLQIAFEGIIISKLKEVENNISRVGDNIKNIEKSLGEEMHTTNIKITNETRATLDDLKNKIVDIKNKIKEIEIDQTFKDILKNVEKQFKDVIKEYKDILSLIFSKQNVENVKKEIETAKRTLRLLADRDAVKIEVENVKHIVDTLKDRGICFIKEAVSVEDRI